MLRKFGLTVEVVNNGAESLEKLRKNLYDLILMDVQMPVMDGITATEMIRKGDSGVLKIDVPVIALTAHAMREDRERCMAAGMDDYMHKPISVQRLSEMLKKWLPVQEGLQEEEESDQKEITEKIESSAIFNGGEETEKPAVFDSDGMLSRLTNDRELAQELVVMVIESFPENLSALEEAIEDQNPKNLMLAAHALKGLAANVGAERLRMVALELEKSGRSGEISGAGSILSEIKVQMELFRQESRWFLSDNP
jgi:CheY-like chemotaxis protein/HPt (histidine-containing phosphotransfer) domain-containing protein